MLAPAIDPMQGHSGIHRIHLKIECRGLYSLLFIPRQPCETIGKSVSDEEFHPRYVCVARSRCVVRLASTIARSFCCAFRRSGSSGHGQPRIAAWRGGGSLEAISSLAAATASALIIAAP